jgi:hypothetical protein
VNNRPLTEVSKGLEDFNTITPSELIIGRKMDTLTDPNFRVREGQLDYKSMWRKRQLLLNAFWKKWSTSYLMNLQIRQKWRIPSEENLQNRLVLIKDDNMSRNEWKKGRIIEQYKSKDGLVRSVLLKTQTGTIRRPIHKMSLFETIF